MADTLKPTSTEVSATATASPYQSTVSNAERVVDTDEKRGFRFTPSGISFTFGGRSAKKGPDVSKGQETRAEQPSPATVGQAETVRRALKPGDEFTPGQPIPQTPTVVTNGNNPAQQPTVITGNNGELVATATVTAASERLSAAREKLTARKELAAKRPQEYGFEWLPKDKPGTLLSYGPKPSTAEQKGFSELVDQKTLEAMRRLTQPETGGIKLEPGDGDSFRKAMVESQLDIKPGSMRLEVPAEPAPRPLLDLPEVKFSGDVKTGEAQPGSIPGGNGGPRQK